MKRINVVTTIEVNEDITIDELYDSFLEVLSETVKFGDLTNFKFMDENGEQVD